MGKSASSVRALPARKSGHITSNAKLESEATGTPAAPFYVKELPDVDTTQWIAHDVPIDLERLVAESQREQKG